MFIKKKIEKTAKGYRLRPQTHSLIKEIQLVLQTDQDTVITLACRMLNKAIERKKKLRKSFRDNDHVL